VHNGVLPSPVGGREVCTTGSPFSRGWERCAQQCLPSPVGGREVCTTVFLLFPWVGERCAQQCYSSSLGRWEVCTTVLISLRNSTEKARKPATERGVAQGHHIPYINRFTVGGEQTALLPSPVSLLVCNSRI